jgi:hypothetical protein
MSDKVLAKVYHFAVNGDTKAAKLYFDIVGSLGAQDAGNTLIKSQNNYIQINGMVLSQENIKSLKPEQILQCRAMKRRYLNCLSYNINKISRCLASSGLGSLSFVQRVEGRVVMMVFLKIYFFYILQKNKRNVAVLGGK